MLWFSVLKKLLKYSINMKIAAAAGGNTLK